MTRWVVPFGIALVASCVPFAFTLVVASSGAGAESVAQEVGNQACAACHKAIYDSYSQTAMARTSGPALANLIEGADHHAASDVTYRVYREGATAFLSYERRGRPELHGRQALKYYVGSNTRGRTFLFDIDGFLYQSPINYYRRNVSGACRRGMPNSARWS